MHSKKERPTVICTRLEEGAASSIVDEFGSGLGLPDLIFCDCTGSFRG